MEKNRNKAILVGQVKKDETVSQVEKSLQELKELVQTLGIEVIHTLIQHKDVQSARFGIGSGKAEELKILMENTGCGLAVFDDDLGPTQQRNLEKLLNCETTDRCGIILAIFSSHAKSREAKLQVELAGMEYSLTHLKRRWDHLSRTKGGVGLRGGDGETQLEVDRRITKEKIQGIKEKLEKVKLQRETRKKNRKNYFQVAIAGYTNCGKSTLLNRLTNSNVLVQDQLFATLDPSTRIIDPREKPPILFTDTVGFIKKLPHHLVASFRSTFEEIQDSDLILHVVDATCEDYQEKIKNTHNILQELKLDSIPRILVFNKMDKCDMEKVQMRLMRSLYPKSVWISASKKQNLEILRQTIYDFFANAVEEIKIELKIEAHKELDELYQLTHVFESIWEEDKILLHLRGASRDINHLIEDFRVRDILIQTTRI